MLAGVLVERVDELLLVLERADAVLLLGRGQGLAAEVRVVNARLDLVQILDDVLLGHVDRDALAEGFLLEFLDRELFVPGRRRRHRLDRLLLRRGRVFGLQEVDQFLLGAQSADLVFGEFLLERLAGEVGVVHARLGLVEQLDEVGLGAGDGDALLLGRHLRLLGGQTIELARLPCLLYRLLAGLDLLGLLLDVLGRQDAALLCGRGVASQRLSTADGEVNDGRVPAAAVRVFGLVRELPDGENLAVERFALRTHPLVAHGQPFELAHAHGRVELPLPLGVGPHGFGPGDEFHARLRLAEYLLARVAERLLVRDDLAHLPGDIAHGHTRGHADQDRPVEAVGEFPGYVAGQLEVEARHEVQGRGVDDGEDVRGHLVDAAGVEVLVERQLRRHELLDAVADAALEVLPAGVSEDQPVFVTDLGDDRSDLALEPAEAPLVGEFSGGQVAQRGVVEQRGLHVLLSARQDGGDLGSGPLAVGVAVAVGPLRPFPDALRLRLRRGLSREQRILLGEVSVQGRLFQRQRHSAHSSLRTRFSK